MSRKIMIVGTAVVVIVILLSAGFVGGFIFKTKMVARGVPGVDGSFPLVSEVMGIIAHTYVDSVEQDELMVGAVKGMLGALEDPYSHYLGAKDYDKFVEETEGHFSGVGMEVGMKDESVVVVAPIDETPAFEAGIVAGDVILAVDEKPTKGLALDEVVKQIRGKKGTKVVLTIGRESEDKPLEFELTRADIRVPNASWKILEGKVGYLHLHFFNKTATSGLKDGVKELKADGAKGLILDLRNNPGGILDEAIGVSSLFLAKGTEVVEIKGRQGKPEIYKTTGGGDADIPLVVLVDEGSASASEIVAGALQDHDRAQLVGEKTFGKASVQDIVDVSNGGAIVITTARYFTPAGRSIYETGIEPDHVLETPHGRTDPEDDKQLDKARAVLDEIVSGVKEAA